MGFCGIFEYFPRFEFFLLPNIVHARPHAGTDYLQGQGLEQLLIFHGCANGRFLFFHFGDLFGGNALPPPSTCFLEMGFQLRFSI